MKNLKIKASLSNKNAVFDSTDVNSESEAIKWAGGRGVTLTLLRKSEEDGILCLEEETFIYENKSYTSIGCEVTYC